MLNGRLEWLDQMGVDVTTDCIYYELGKPLFPSNILPSLNVDCVKKIFQRLLSDNCDN